jgi:signal transduction histidine kinase
MHRAFLSALGLPLALLLLAVAPFPAAAAESAFDARVAAAQKALMGDPRRALELAKEAEQLSANVPGRRESATAAATAKWLQAESLIGLNRIDEAQAPAEEANRLIAQVGTSSKLAGDIERTLGAIAGTKGDVQQALRRYQAAHRFFTAAGEQRSRSMALLDIGQVYWDAADYARVLQYFDQAEELIAPDDANLQLVLHSSRGEVFRAMRRFGEAEPEYTLALKAARALHSDMLQLRILTNLALAQAMAGRIDAANLSVRRGLALAGEPDVAEWRPFLYAAAARVAARQGDWAAAAQQLDKAFYGRDLGKTDMSFREPHELAAQVYEAIGRKDEALAHLRAFQRLDKQAQALVATNSAQLMAAQFDFANQNLRISQLKQGQLQRDIQIERQRSRYRTNLFVGVMAAGLIVLALLLFGFFSIRRSRNQVRAANTELAGTNVALEKALKAKSEFLATTSHEIRTPLNGILGMTQVMLADRNVEAALRQKIEVVHGAGETMQALVDDLLDVAKMEHGGLTLAIDRTDIRRLVEDAVRLWRGQAEVKGLSLSLDCADLPATILTDGGRVRQILFNLLSNAVKFTLAGQIAVTCRVDESEAGGSLLTFAVSDSGIGIAAEHHDTIFEAFSQVDGGTTRQFSGTGLGLSIVKSLAEALGGEINVASRPTEGSTFTVTIPVEVLELATAESAEGDGLSGLGAATVLILDGDPHSQAVMRLLFIPLAANVEVASTVAEAIARVEQGGVDVVIADAGAIAEPGERVAGLRALALATRQAGIRLSILQATDGAPPVAELFTVGPDQLITKPIAANALLEAVAALWSADPPMFVAPALTGGKAAA